VAALPMKIHVSLISLCILLAGCGADERVCDFSEVVQMQSYDQTFRDRLAENVDHICGNSEKGMPAEFEYACKFIQDSLELRAKIAATQ
jgi:hypothetical protein